MSKHTANDIYKIQGESGWSDNTLLQLLTSFIEERGQLDQCIEFLSEQMVEDEENSEDDEDFCESCGMPTEDCACDDEVDDEDSDEPE